MHLHILHIHIVYTHISLFIHNIYIYIYIYVNTHVMIYYGRPRRREASGSEKQPIVGDDIIDDIIVISL